MAPKGKGKAGTEFRAEVFFLLALPDSTLQRSRGTRARGQRKHSVEAMTLRSLDQLGGTVRNIVRLQNRKFFESFVSARQHISHGRTVKFQALLALGPSKKHDLKIFGLTI